MLATKQFRCASAELIAPKHGTPAALKHRQRWPSLLWAKRCSACRSQTHVRIVPLSPSAQPQGGLSLPPSWGRFFVHSRGQSRPLSQEIAFDPATGASASSASLTNEGGNAPCLAFVVR